MKSATRGEKVPPLALSGRSIRLRPARPSDVEPLFELTTDPEVWHRANHRASSIPSYAKFSNQFQFDSGHGFIIESLTQAELVGWVSAYGEDEIAAYAYADVIVSPDYFDTGAGVEAFGLFVNYLFQCKNYRKVYIEAVDFTLHTYSSGLRRFFVEEGRLRDHEYLYGRYWDRYVFAVYRDTWAEHVMPMLTTWLACEPAVSAG
jgi:RimJ/RimL family protein N-acetyltransferase